MRPAVLLLAAALSTPAPRAGGSPPLDLEPAIAALEAELVAAHGEAVREPLRRGLRQAAALWRAEDGDAVAFATLVRTHFAADPATRDALFTRLQQAVELLYGHLAEIGRGLRRHVDLDAGAILPFDQILAAYDPGAHLSEDLFGNQIAFVVLLNFRLTTLEERAREGPSWTRRQWAEARLAQLFAERLPASAAQAYSAAVAAGATYVDQYNVWMHHLLDEAGGRPFPPGLRLISHWNLRDEIKAAYADPDAARGLGKQRLIETVMERIVTQTIPAAVIDDPRLDWRPVANTVTPSPARDWEGERPPLAAAPSAAPEPDTRYRRILDVFHAARLADPHSPASPTFIARRFDQGRELAEARVRVMFEELLGSPLLPRVGALVVRRLGRPLEPFDIWYAGFEPRATHGEEEVDALVGRRYPDAAAFERDVPAILERLGFAPDRARRIAAQVEVHAARGAGHAFGAGLRGQKSWLRTRVEKGGMNYKGYNIAVHELGHNVEQVLSLEEMDHYLLSGVPNSAFTEALAFVFQEHDLELLDLQPADAESRALRTLSTFWNAAEIAAVGLVDMEMWHWLYEHPEATSAELRQATAEIARRVWNRWWAPVLGRRDSPLLGVYSHMISYPLYLPDYPIGHLVAFQIREQMERAGAVGSEFERMARIGDLSPDVWMVEATGRPVGPQALLAATERALAAIDKGTAVVSW
jgi:hypothetical protein